MLLAQFQSALPRGERQLRQAYQQPAHPISIRAPARGATYFSLYSVNLPQFQSALPRGERLNLSIRSWLITNFNPRSREGSDCHNQLAHMIPANFNPRSREGSDSFWNRSVNLSRKFQSALPRGERRLSGDSGRYVRRISIRAPARGATVLSWLSIG